MMKKRLSLIISLVAAIVLLSAASALFLMDREQPAAHKAIKSERPRVASPDAIDSEIRLWSMETVPSLSNYIRRSGRPGATFFTHPTAFRWLWR